ncbi:MAG: ABC transporter ATP-binding protein [Bacteroidota bacterium]
MKSLLRLFPYLARYRKILLLGFLTVVLSNLFTVAQPFLIGRAIDTLKEGLEAHALGGTDLLGYAALVVGFSLVAGFFTFLTRQTIIVVSRHVEYDLRNDFLSHLQKLSLPYFQRTSTGDLMAHATNDISAVRNAMGPGIMYPTVTSMIFLMVLSVMVYTDWQLTLIALLPLPLVSYAVYRLGKLIHQKFEERQKQYSALTTRALENLSGIRVVKAYVRETHETQLFRDLSWEYLRKNLVVARIQSIMWPLMFLLVGLSLILTLYFGGARVIDDQMTIGTLTAFFGYLVMLIWPMIAFGWVINILQQGAASMLRLGKILDTRSDIEDSEATDHAVSSLKGSIEFRDVVFTHRGAGTPALNRLSLTIPEGSTVAIVGYTGAGKSTLVNLIPRLYDVTEGELLVDGRNIREIPLVVLRENIGYVPQETFLFSETIEENIRYGTDDAGQQGLDAAADVAQLSSDVGGFPQGFQTVLGERGITLSGGQKQRTSLARAVMREPRILVLDDALSAVDTYTEEQILKRLRKLMKGRTSIIISHRISTVKEADTIVVVHEGSIAEQGTHDDLVSHGGIYAELYRKQLLEEELEHM